MPTYQYTCTDCTEPLEVVQSFSDAALTQCPACSGRLRKVYGAVGVVFKGSGFYKTDSRSDSKASSSSTDGGSPSTGQPAAAGASTPAPAASAPAPSAASSPAPASKTA